MESFHFHLTVKILYFCFYVINGDVSINVALDNVEYIKNTKFE